MKLELRGGFRDLEVSGQSDSRACDSNLWSPLPLYQSPYKNMEQLALIWKRKNLQVALHFMHTLNLFKH